MSCSLFTLIENASTRIALIAELSHRVNVISGREPLIEAILSTSRVQWKTFRHIFHVSSSSLDKKPLKPSKMSIILGSRVQVCLEKNIGYFIVYQHFEAQYMQLDKAPSHVPISAHGSRKYRAFLTLLKQCFQGLECVFV